MRYWLLAGVSACSAFAVFAALGSIAARLWAGPAVRWSAHWPPSPRARLLCGLRLLPAAAAALAGFAIALPIFLWFEDTTTTEPIGRTLAALGGAGAVLLGRGLWRALSSWRSTTRVVRDWRRRGRPLDGLSAPMPAYAIDDAFPLVAIAGVAAPRLFVSERILRACSPDEVAAMVAHECAHVSARDNLKRLLMRACPDVFGASATLERAWSAAAEEAADAAAARRHGTSRLDLAQALIHVARLAAPRAPALASAFFLGGSIEARVRQLLLGADEPAAPRWVRLAVSGAAAAFAAAVILAAPTVHRLMEQAVRLLP